MPLWPALDARGSQLAARSAPPDSQPAPKKRDETDLPCADEFQARSPDELTLARGDRVELIERDDDFGDGWFLGRNTETGDSGLFPEGMILIVIHRYAISSH